MCAVLREYLKQIIFRRNTKASGDDDMKVTPVPIPNTKVKLHGADGTAGEALWESRKSPGFEINRSKFS